MATEYAILDLYHLFVEVLFGHFILALIGIAVIMAIICGLFRMSMFMILTIVGLFLFIMMIGYYGSVAGVFFLFFAFTYFMYSLIRWIQGNIAT